MAQNAECDLGNSLHARVSYTRADLKDAEG